MGKAVVSEIESHPVLVQVRYLRSMPTLDSCRRFLKWGYPRIQFIFGVSTINHPVMGVPPTMETGHPQSQLADWPGLCWPCCHELQAPRDLQEGSHVDPNRSYGNVYIYNYIYIYIIYIYMYT